MSSTPEPHEIRDPVHGFITLNELEWDVIHHPAFQRLRRIRQLGWTDLVYPGAMHTRFEHSLGVMHVAGRLFDAIRLRSFDVLSMQYGYDDDGLGRRRKIIRLAALLHDVGHGPFSHAAEHMFPEKPLGGGRYTHEDYSGAIIRSGIGEIIEGHRFAEQNGIRIADILSAFDSLPRRSDELVWKGLVAGQMDADRMDYLLRDAYHAGVQYGRYDLDRVVNTIRLCPDPEGDGHHIGIYEGGVHAVEGLLVARYMMFVQLYFHQTRAIYDYHLGECLSELLGSNGGHFPSPENIGEFLKWDDWRVLGLVGAGQGGEHGAILAERNHFRRVYETDEDMTSGESEMLKKLESELEIFGCVTLDPKKSWYKPGAQEIFVWREHDGNPRPVPLLEISKVVGGLVPVNQRRIYVPMGARTEALKVIHSIAGRPVRQIIRWRRPINTR